MLPAAGFTITPSAPAVTGASAAVLPSATSQTITASHLLSFRVTLVPFTTAFTPSSFSSFALYRFTSLPTVTFATGLRYIAAATVVVAPSFLISFPLLTTTVVLSLNWAHWPPLTVRVVFTG